MKMICELSRWVGSPWDTAVDVRERAARSVLILLPDVAKRFGAKFSRKTPKMREDAISKCQDNNYSVKSMLLKTEPQKRIVEVNFRQMQMEHFFVKLKEFAIEMKNVCSNKELFWWNWCFILNIDGFYFKINLLPNYQVLFRYPIFKSSFRSNTYMLLSMILRTKFLLIFNACSCYTIHP